jgi:hypothetical protein
MLVGVKQSGPSGVRCQTVWFAAGEAILAALSLRFVWQCEGAVVILGGLHMSTHSLGKHPMCHTSRLQHEGLGSHLNLNFLYD